jgi:hypothetical protein
MMPITIFDFFRFQQVFALNNLAAVACRLPLSCPIMTITE